MLSFANHAGGGGEGGGASRSGGGGGTTTTTTKRMEEDEEASMSSSSSSSSGSSEADHHHDHDHEHLDHEEAEEEDEDDDGGIITATTATTTSAQHHYQQEDEEDQSEDDEEEESSSNSSSSSSSCGSGGESEQKEKRRRTPKKKKKPKKYLLPPPVYARRDFVARTAEEALMKLLEFGVAVVPHALTAQEAEQTNDGIMEALEATFPGFDRHAPETWRMLRDNGAKHAMLLQHHGLGGWCQAAADVRQKPEIAHIFAELWTAREIFMGEKKKTRQEGDDDDDAAATATTATTTTQSKKFKKGNTTTTTTTTAAKKEEEEEEEAKKVSARRPIKKMDLYSSCDGVSVYLKDESESRGGYHREGHDWLHYDRAPDDPKWSVQGFVNLLLTERNGGAAFQCLVRSHRNQREFVERFPTPTPTTTATATATATATTPTPNTNTTTTTPHHHHEHDHQHLHLKERMMMRSSNHNNNAEEEEEDDAKKKKKKRKEARFRLIQSQPEVDFLLNECGNQHVCIRAKVGDLVLWDSRLMHCGRAATRAASLQLRRTVVYVSMQPKWLSTQRDRTQKLKAFKELRTTSHNAASGVKLFPRFPRAFGRHDKRRNAASRPIVDPPLLTELGLSLFGVDGASYTQARLALKARAALEEARQQGMSV